MCPNLEMEESESQGEKINSVDRTFKGEKALYHVCIDKHSSLGRLFTIDSQDANIKISLRWLSV